MSTARRHVVGYSAARASLAKLMDEVIDDRREIIVTRRGGNAVVLVSLEEYQSLQETVHLLRSPRNARRLLKAVQDADARRFVKSPRR